MPTTPKNINEYIAGFPTDVQEILQKVRDTITKAVPRSEETISYKMPTFNLDGRHLIYFAAYKKHIGIYPVPSGDEKFREQIARYEAGKGTLQFPLDQPIPYPLIARIAKLRAKESRVQSAAKAKNNT